MICAKCQQTIRPAEPYTTHDIPAASGAGITIYRHTVCPDRR